MCTVLLPPGVNTIAVNKFIISVSILISISHIIAVRGTCGGHSRINEVTVKVKFTLEQATKAQRGSRGIALPFHQPRL